MIKSTTCKFASTISLTLVVTVLFTVIAMASSENPDLGATIIEPSVIDRFDDRFAAHTKILHDKLDIAPQQESLWNNVARVMLENAKSMEILVKSRPNNDKDMTAVDDLKSYYEIAMAHAEGLKKFIPAFEALYASMSDDQQKNANILFQSQRQKMIVNKASSK